MHTITRSAGTALLLAAGLALGACGGDDGGSSSGGGDALDRAALGKQLDAICTTATTEAGKLTPGDLGDAKVAATYFGKVEPITQKETDAIEALTPDDDVKADYDALVSAQNAANDLLKQIAEKARNADATGVDDLQKVAPAGEKVAAAAKKAGATTCG